ncbi:MAG: CoA transferase [Hyphomicrobiales bacterium]|nr:CoA transferase [Hyphomicrobiales bacterium]
MAGPLADVKIIDLTSMISGPLATMTLADQGANVIKVEAPSGDHTRQASGSRGGFSASFLNNNRNKRSLVLDLKKPEGLAALLKLCADADVVIQNFRPGVADRIGVGEEAIRQINSSVIYMSICGFGFDGPYAHRPVFDPLVQALSGLTTVQAGSDQERPRLVRTILPDKLTGIQAAQAITAALYSRSQTGKGQHIQLSMLDTIISFLWSSDMGGHTFVGDETEIEQAQSLIDLVYHTLDGFITIAIQQDKDWRGFARAVYQTGLIDDQRFSTPQMREKNKNVRMEIIQQAVTGFRSAEILKRLEDEDVPCAPVLSRRAMRDNEQVIANDIIIETKHPVAGTLRQARHPAKFSNTPTKIVRGAPERGEHSFELLTEAGFDDDAIHQLEKSGAVFQHQPGEQK